MNGNGVAGAPAGTPDAKIPSGPIAERWDNHKQSILLSKIMNKLANFKVDPKKFAIYHEIIRRKLRNFQAEQPHRHAIYYTSILLDSQMWSTEDLAEALEGEREPNV